ncbi:hypothetical protein EVAR_25596_1 [Eumeta japonica]|uniref:Uncharacterized protein n=1 Tax=Eumeta variegata TaxID=151549 RepID=A0A4C1V228_EUMVA|nr:hypothetical protein EVAR_25596_1 [Eumeta japonica]
MCTAPSRLISHSSDSVGTMFARKWRPPWSGVENRVRRELPREAAARARAHRVKSQCSFNKLSTHLRNESSGIPPLPPPINPPTIKYSFSIHEASNALVYCGFWGCEYPWATMTTSFLQVAHRLIAPRIYNRKTTYIHSSNKARQKE